jgi:hypothetical protein
MSFSATSSFQRGDIASLVERIRAGATAAVVQTSEHVLQQAQVLVPIDTGALYASGKITLEQMPEGPTGFVNFDQDYGGFVEFGTYKMRAQPYLRPAMDAAHGVFLDAVTAGVRDAL